MAASPLIRASRKPKLIKHLRRATVRPPVSRLTRSRGKGYAALGISRDTLIRLIDHPELPLRIHTRETIKAGRSALLVQGEFPVGDRMVSVAYKCVRRRGFGKMLTAWLFGNRTLATWKTARTLEDLGIPTARPLLVIVPRWFQPAMPSYIAYEWVDQAKNLTAYSHWLNGQADDEARERLHAAAETLGEVVGAMHRNRVSHRDLKAGNLLLANRPSSVEAFVIDLDGARRFLWLPRSRRFRDLSRLAFATAFDETITHSARLRFLRAYMKAAGENQTSWKTFWRRVAEMAQRRQVKKSRQGRRHP